MPRIIASDCGCRGRVRMSSCHGLSWGNTWSASRTRSASGVSNISGLSILGIDKTKKANETAARSLDNHDLEIACAQRRDDLLIQLVVGDDAMNLVQAGDRRQRAPEELAGIGHRRHL